MTQGLSGPAAGLTAAHPPLPGASAGLWVQVGGRSQGPRDVHRGPAFQAAFWLS